MSAEVLKVLTDVALALSPALVAVLGYAAAKVAQLVNSKVKNEYLRGAFGRLSTLAFQVVKEIMQTVVEDLKKAKEDGKLTDDEKKVIKQHALELLKSHLGVKGLKELLAVLGIDQGALDKFLSSRLEAALYDVKHEEASFLGGPLG